MQMQIRCGLVGALEDSRHVAKDIPSSEVVLAAKLSGRDL